MSLKILIADGHRILRESIRGMLELHDGFEVVGDVEDCGIAVNMARHLKPDIIVVDVSKNELNGIQTIHQIKAFIPEVRIVFLDVLTDERCVRRMLRLNPDAYLLKDCAFEELLNAIEVVSRGEKYLCVGVSTFLIDDYVRQLSTGEMLRTSGLTSRQKEVLQLVTEGRTTKGISETLDLSEHTVENHRRNIMNKLNIRSVAELTKYAIREGITTL